MATLGAVAAETRGVAGVRTAAVRGDPTGHQHRFAIGQFAQGLAVQGQFLAELGLEFVAVHDCVPFVV